MHLVLALGSRENRDGAGKRYKPDGSDVSEDQGKPPVHNGYVIVLWLSFQLRRISFFMDLRHVWYSTTNR